MTLLEMKKKTLALIEEKSTQSGKLTDDPDIEGKINDVINQIQFELARIKKLPAIKKENISLQNLSIDLNEIEGFYQLDHILFENIDGEEEYFEIFGQTV